jgi:subtilisin-like proprotein convertase family protein
MMKQLLLTLFLLVFLLVYASGQTFNGSGGTVANDGSASIFTIEVTGLTPDTIDSAFGLESVTINLMHTYDAELDVKLIAPDSTIRTLTYANGFSGDNYSITIFTDFGLTSITNGTAPFNGSYKPQEPMGNMNNGQNGNGSWKLYVHDMNPNNNNSGYLVSWNITFGYNPSPSFAFTSSNLPIILINTHGQQIPDDPKIPVDFDIVYNGPGQRNFITDSLNYDGFAGIEIRGSSSQMFPKKSYGFETWDVFGQSIDTTLLGMPSESDWILNANYTDKTFCRNVLAYQTWMNMGEYATRYRYVELVLNGEYMGIYVLSEKIKRSKNRLDISKLKPEDNTGDQVTGGYILKIDKWTGSGGDGWTSPFPPPVNPDGQSIFIQYDYPEADVITPEQKSYIQSYVTDFEAALEGPNFADTAIGYHKYADEVSFFNYFIVNEISKNVDGYRLSTFFHKDRDSKGGKIKMGPVWDYDIAWHNADYCDGDLVTGWAYQFPCSYDTWQVPFWWARLLQDPQYASHLKCQWLTLRQTVLSDQYFFKFIDSIALQLDEAQTRNFYKWPILGTYVWPNPSPIPTTYSGEIYSLKSWISLRLNWIDTHLPGTCYTVGQKELTEKLPELEVFPNPATVSLSISSEQSATGKVKLEIVSQSGSTLIAVDGGTRNPGYYTDQMNIESLSPGVYLLRLTMNGMVVNRKVVKM